MTKNNVTKNNNDYVSIKTIQVVKRKMVLSFMKYIETHEIKNKKNIARLIKDYDELTYTNFISNKTMNGGTRRVSSHTASRSQNSLSRMDYYAFVVFFGGIIGCMLIYHNYLDFEAMVQDNNIERDFLQHISRIDAEDTVCGEITENADATTIEDHNNCVVRAPVMISLYQVLFYIKLFFLNTPTAALSFTRGITIHFINSIHAIALRNADELISKSGNNCISGVRTGVFSMAWSMVSSFIPVNPPPGSGGALNCMKYVTMSQADILSKEIQQESIMFLNKVTLILENIQCLTSWTASALTMSSVYFMRRYKGLGRTIHNLIQDRGDYIRAENMGIIEAVNSEHTTQTAPNTSRPMDYSRMRVYELQQELRKRRLRVSGRKAELIRRLESSNSNRNSGIGGGNKTRKKKSTIMH